MTHQVINMSPGQLPRYHRNGASAFIFSFYRNKSNVDQITEGEEILCPTQKLGPFEVACAITFMVRAAKSQLKDYDHNKAILVEFREAINGGVALALLVNSYVTLTAPPMFFDERTGEAI